ncbi:RNA recognition motif-containing protein [Babesia caballi]|uniref:RNA recognition motif-containing protein n=1 Tax=Babesia caballi TaxID=5871 RepID=A0AAV4LL20_BABCB|nr:RNA recognition motif-containing protein [Babesia caballi]
MGSRAGDVLSIYDRNQEATLYVGNLDTQVDEELLWEFFVQVGPVKHVHIPRDKVTGHHQGYGFVEFETEDDADYAVRILNFVKLYNKPLKCNKASRDKQTFEIGANLFIGNLDADVDDKLLHDTFASFGNIISAKVVRDVDSADGKTYAFISYDSFEASDAALAAMNGQFIANKPIHVSYAYKKDTKGERHGSAAERLIAANRPQEFLSQMGVAPYGSAVAPAAPTAPVYPPPITTPPIGMPPVIPQPPVHMGGVNAFPRQVASRGYAVALLLRRLAPEKEDDVLAVEVYELDDPVSEGVPAVVLVGKGLAVDDGQGGVQHEDALLGPVGEVAVAAFDADLLEDVAQARRQRDAPGHGEGEAHGLAGLVVRVLADDDDLHLGEGNELEGVEYQVLWGVDLLGEAVLSHQRPQLEEVGLAELVGELGSPF